MVAKKERYALAEGKGTHALAEEERFPLAEEERFPLAEEENQGIQPQVMSGE